MDGSGKIRENHKEIGNVIKDILSKTQTRRFQCGSLFLYLVDRVPIIGTLLISEMLSRGISVLAVCVGTDESVLTANNTLKSLKSLDAIC